MAWDGVSIFLAIAITAIAIAMIANDLMVKKRAHSDKAKNPAVDHLRAAARTQLRLNVELLKAIQQMHEAARRHSGGE